MTERQRVGKRSGKERRVKSGSRANGDMCLWERRLSPDRRGGVQEQAGGVTPVLTLRWGLFCGHLSRSDMPLLIARDKTFLEHYAEEHLRFAYVQWVVMPITAEQAVEWFRPV